MFKTCNTPVHKHQQGGEVLRQHKIFFSYNVIQTAILQIPTGNSDIAMALYSCSNLCD